MIEEMKSRIKEGVELINEFLRETDCKYCVIIDRREVIEILAKDDKNTVVGDGVEKISFENITPDFFLSYYSNLFLSFIAFYEFKQSLFKLLLDNTIKAFNIKDIVFIDNGEDKKEIEKLVFCKKGEVSTPYITDDYMFVFVLLFYYINETEYAPMHAIKEFILSGDNVIDYIMKIDCSFKKYQLILDIRRVGLKDPLEIYDKNKKLIFRSGILDFIRFILEGDKNVRKS